MSRVGIAHHPSAITVGGAHPTATFLWAFVSQRLMTVHPKIPLLTHPHPDPPLEGEGNSLSLRERGRVRVGIFMSLCEPPANGCFTRKFIQLNPFFMRLGERIRETKNMNETKSTVVATEGRSSQ